MVTQSLQKRILGWLPKEPIAAHTIKPLKPRWKRPAWIALTLIAVVALSFFAYRGIQIYINYSNPKADVTASGFDKTLNCTTANVGDIVEVKTRVYWHGHVFPEFQRQVNITDSFSQCTFELVSGNNTIQYNGCGGGDQITYLLKVIGADSATFELPKPRLYLDGTEIPITGTTTVSRLQTTSKTTELKA
jgi:hypothetical protein